MSINFTARLADYTTISQRVSMFKRKDVPASIIEFDNKNSNDMLALHQASTRWCDNGGKYSATIFSKANSKYTFSDIEKSHYYGLTTQQKNFEKVEPDKLLGLMMFSETKNLENEIDYLEVSPFTSKSKNFIREYKKVGSRLIEFVKRAYKNKDIYVESDYTAIKFYKKLGFKQQAYYKFPSPCCLIYSV